MSCGFRFVSWTVTDSGNLDNYAPFRTAMVRFRLLAAPIQHRLTIGVHNSPQTQVNR